jgi:hypothetical protein
MISTVTLTLDLTNKTGRVTDTTNYSALNLGVATFEAKGLGTIYFQGQQIVSKTSTSDPLIDLQDGDTYFDFPLELDVNGEVANGVYQVDYSLRVNTLTTNFPVTITLPGTMNIGSGFEWVLDFLEVGDSIKLFNPITMDQQFVPYASGQFVDPNFILETDTLIDDATYPYWGVNLINAQSSTSYTYSGCTKSSAAITFAYDCEYAPNGTFSVASATDLNGQTVASTSAIINYPSWTAANPNFNPKIVTNTLPYTQNTLATGTYTVSLSQVIQTTQDDGLILQYTASTIEEFKVSCTGTLCGLNTCIENLRAAHVAELKSNKISKYQPYVDNVVMYYTEAQTYKTCGDFDNYNIALNKIKEQLDSSGCDCSCCNDDVYEWIQVNTNASIESLINAIQYRLKDGQPDQNDDETAGVELGAIWQDTVTGILYRCSDPTAANAQWDPYYDPGSIIVTASGVTSNPQVGGIVNGTNVQANIDSITNYLSSVDTSLTTFNADITDLQNTSVFSVTGNFVDNTDPQNPVVINPGAGNVVYNATINGTTITTVQGALEVLRISQSNYDNDLLYYSGIGNVANTLDQSITGKIACRISDSGGVTLVSQNMYDPALTAPTLTLQLDQTYILAFPASVITTFSTVLVTPNVKEDGITVKAQRESASTVKVMFVNAAGAKTSTPTNCNLVIEVYR